VSRSFVDLADSFVDIECLEHQRHNIGAIVLIPEPRHREEIGRVVIAMIDMPADQLVAALAS
jgi:hypothetical protein